MALDGLPDLGAQGCSVSGHFLFVGVGAEDGLRGCAPSSCCGRLEHLSTNPTCSLPARPPTHPHTRIPCLPCLPCPQVVLTGAKKREDIYRAFENIYPVLQTFRKGGELMGAWGVVSLADTDGIPRCCKLAEAAPKGGDLQSHIQWCLGMGRVGDRPPVAASLLPRLLLYGTGKCINLSQALPALPQA